MANEIGLELEEPNAPSQDRTKGAFAKFFDDPKNIATALIFGASLAMPRQQGQDGLSTLVQRAAGAAAFRGTLEGGLQKKKLEREQTAFERAQAEQETQLRQRQVAAQEQGVGLQATQLNMQQNQFERELMANDENARLDRELQASLASIRNAPTEADLIAIASQQVPYLLDTMEFEEGLTPQQKMAIAQDEAVKGVMIFRNILASGGQVVRGPDGQYFIDDGKGNNLSPSQATRPPAPTSAPTPAPSPAPQPTETAEQRAARLKAEQRRAPFAPTFGQRVQQRGAENQVLREQSARRQAMATLKNRALNLQRLLEIGGRPTTQHVKEIAFFTDQELQEMGLRPQAIVGLRRLAEQLPAQ